MKSLNTIMRATKKGNTRTSNLMTHGPAMKMKMSLPSLTKTIKVKSRSKILSIKTFSSTNWNKKTLNKSRIKTLRLIKKIPQETVNRLKWIAQMWPIKSRTLGCTSLSTWTKWLIKIKMRRARTHSVKATPILTKMISLSLNSLVTLSIEKSLKFSTWTSN